MSASGTVISVLTCKLRVTCTVHFRNWTWGHLIGYAASVFPFMSLIKRCALETVIKLERTAHRLPKGLYMGHSLKLSSTDLPHTHTHWQFQPEGPSLLSRCLVNQVVEARCWRCMGIITHHPNLDLANDLTIRSLSFFVFHIASVSYAVHLNRLVF